MVVMKLISHHQFLKNAQKPTIAFAFWRCLQLPFSTTVNQSHSSSSLENPSLEMADYLVNACGFSSEEARDVHARLGSRGTVQKATKTIGFFRESGFTDTQIRKTVSRSPDLLASKVEKTLRPKVRAFLDWGLSPFDVADMVARNPFVLDHSLERCIIPIACIVKDVITDNDKVAKSIKALFLVRHFRMVAINLPSLRSRGISDRSLWRLLLWWPKILCANPSSLQKMVAKAEELGFRCDSTNFSEALSVCSMSESAWDARMEVLKGFGWTQEQIMAALRKFPLFMNLSQRTLRKKLEFFVDKLRYDPSKITANPTLLAYHTEKRVIPRLAVIEELDSRNILKWKKSLYPVRIFQISEESFYKEFVLKHKNGCPSMFQAYENSTKGSITRSRLT